MIRVALAAVLLVAVAGLGVAAAERGATERTSRRLAANAEAVERAVGLLADRDDPTAAGVPGARRVVSVRLPPRSLASAGVERFALRGERDTVTYRVGGGRTRRHAVPVDLRTPAGPVVLRSSGRHRLRLSLVGPPTGVRVERGRSGEG